MVTKETANNNRFKLAKQQLNLRVHRAFLSVAVFARLRLEMSHVLLGSEQLTPIFFPFFLKLKTSPLEFTSRGIAII